MTTRRSSVESSHTPIKRNNKGGKKEEDNGAVHHIATMKKNVRIVTMHNDPHLNGIKQFLKDALLDEFFFIKPRECRIPDAK